MKTADDYDWMPMEGFVAFENHTAENGDEFFIATTQDGNRFLVDRHELTRSWPADTCGWAVMEEAVVRTPRPYCSGPCACSGACYFTDVEWYLWLAYGVPRNPWDSEAEQYPYGRCVECQGRLEPKYATSALRCIICNRPAFAGGHL